MGLRVPGSALHKRATRWARKPDAQRPDDRPRDFVLHGEYIPVPRVSVVFLRPNLVAPRHVDELRADPSPVSPHPHAPVQHIENVELPPDLFRDDTFPFETERR